MNSLDIRTSDSLLVFCAELPRLHLNFIISYFKYLEFNFTIFHNKISVIMSFVYIYIIIISICNMRLYNFWYDLGLIVSWIFCCRHFRVQNWVTWRPSFQDFSFVTQTVQQLPSLQEPTAPQRSTKITYGNLLFFAVSKWYPDFGAIHYNKVDCSISTIFLRACIYSYCAIISLFHQKLLKEMF